MQKDDYAGTNLFAYCFNNPINNFDYDGKSVAGKLLRKAVLGIISAAITLFLSDIICIASKIHKTFSSAVTYLSEMVQGALDGVLNKGPLKTILIAAVSNIISQIENRVKNNSKYNFSNVLISFGSSITLAGLKYVLNNKLHMHIDSKIEKKISQKFTGIFARFITYACTQLKNIAFNSISYNVIKKVISAKVKNIYNFTIALIKRDILVFFYTYGG